MEVAAGESQPLTVNTNRVEARDQEPTIPLEQTPEFRATLSTLVAKVYHPVVERGLVNGQFTV